MPTGWQKPPWWVAVFGTLVALSATVVLSAQVTGRVGWQLRRTTSADGGLEVRVLLTIRESPAADAGFQAGDRITVRDLHSFIRTIRSGGTYAFEVDRAGEVRTTVMRVPHKSWSFWRSSEGLQTALAVAATVLCLVCAAVLVLLRSHDGMARWGALLLAQMAIVGGQLGTGLSWPEIAGAALRLPPLLTVAALVGLSASNTLPATALTLLGRFPAPPFRGRLLLLLWLPALATGPLAISLQWIPVYWMESGPVLPDWPTAIAYGVGAIYVAAAMALLWRNYLRLTDPNHRRRVRVLVIGLTVSTGAFLVELTVGTPAWLSSPGHDWPARPQGTPWLTPVLSTAAPICVAYAILRHRMFDIPVIIRLGLRYAAARGILLSLAPLAGLALVADLLARGAQPLFTILRTRGWLYGLLAIGGLLLHTRQRIWLRALDRRFFRERYDAQRILRTVVEDLGHSASYDDAAARVVSAIDDALHPRFALLTVREASGSPRVAASCGDAPPPVGGKLMALVRAVERPVEVAPGETSWVLRQLPSDEASAVRAANIDWIFPIALAPKPRESVLILGPKRSEEPYAREDQELLQAITGSLALVLARAAVRPDDARQAFGECPDCGACLNPGADTCPSDGAPLVRCQYSRTVAARYRLDRRLGRGGMGVVYEGFDRELGRRVALKLMRLDGFVERDALARFRIEAKAAAAFSHPNVVTVYDFGVADDGRAYLVMELLNGCTLREALARHGRLAPARAGRVLSDVLAAVGAAHARGMLHRDLKPENIFLSFSGGQEIAKVLDFGIVKHLTADAETATAASFTAPGYLVGTRSYMAPEQLAGGPPRTSWDLWALAVVAFETLTGSHPCGTRREMPDWWALRIETRGVPAAWHTFFATALALDPARRPASAAAFETALQTALTEGNNRGRG